MTGEGRKLENKISKVLLKVNKKERGFFIKSPTPMKLIKTNEKIIPIYSNKALCDFIGIYNTMFILIEVKNISGVRFEFKRLGEHQEKQLSSIKRHGGISFIIFGINNASELIIINIDDYLVYKTQTEKKSINIDTLKNIGKIISIDQLEEYINSQVS